MISLKILTAAVCWLVCGTARADDAEISHIDLGDSSALILKLPIHIKAPDYEQGNSRRGSTHLPKEQRLVMRTYDPTQDQESENNEDEEEEEGDEDSKEENPTRYGFLRWDTNNPNMMLNIKDYYDMKSLNYEDDRQDEDSESREWTEDLDGRQGDYPQFPATGRTRRRRPGDDSDDDEGYESPGARNSRYDSGRREKSRRRPTGNDKSSRVTGSGNFEDLRGGVYGTDPVVHLISEKRRNSKHRRQRSRHTEQPRSANRDYWWW